MITNTGKTLIAKYLIGQAPGYAAYLAFGCGPKALTPSDSFSDYSSKESLDFEMFRSPIISRGYVNEDGQDKIVLTAQLPTEERYEITEVGVYSGASNPSASQNDSRTLILFNDDEGWEFHDQSSIDPIQFIASPLHDDSDNIISVEEPSFSANANNPTFLNTFRISRQERPRFLNNTIITRGDISNLVKFAPIVNVTTDGTLVTYTTLVPHTLQAGQTNVTISGIDPSQFNLTAVQVNTVIDQFTFTVAESGLSGEYESGGQVPTNYLVYLPESAHIHLLGANFNLNRNSPNDELRLAFSVLNKNGNLSNEYPDKVRIIVEFSDLDSSFEGQRAQFQVDLSNGSGGLENGEWDFVNNRFVVLNQKLRDLFQTPTFNWANVELVKVYISVIDDSGPSDNFYISLDAMRLENLSTRNPVYGMSAYSVVKTEDGNPLIKDLNTTNLTEFRFGIDIGT
jgi:hypothetical protein